MNLINKKIGYLTLLDKDIRKDNNGTSRIYYFCKCDCGNEKWIQFAAIRSGNQKSCGCLRSNKAIISIIGKKYGRLKVIESTKERDKYSGAVIWKCLCECGNIINVSTTKLKDCSVRSCGCLAKQIRSNSGKNVSKIHIKNNIIEDTNIQVLTREKPFKNNKSGTTGVSWDKARNKWVSKITFKKKVYYLGRFDNKEDAIDARKDAEEKLHKRFLREKGLLD